MSVASGEQRNGETSLIKGGGFPWQAFATGTLGLIILLVSWVFLNTTSDIKASIKEQGDDLKTLRKEVADNHLELVRKTDSLDKDIALANAHLDAIGVKVGAVQAQVPVPQQKK